MTSPSFQAHPSWCWPEDIPGTFPSNEGDGQTNGNRGNQRDDSPKLTQENRQPDAPRPRHWCPRTCRICLEVVQPNFNWPENAENLPNAYQSKPTVTYDSEDGRLIRPCKCKGSSKYVHEGCLQRWRHADPGYGRRNYWQCPTCGFQYQLERLRWGRWISSVGELAVHVVLSFWPFRLIHCRSASFPNPDSFPSGHVRSGFCGRPDHQHVP